MTKDDRANRHIVVADRAGLPFSKGLLAQSIMATGVDPARAFEVAERIERELLSVDRLKITRDELRELAASTLADVVDRHAADTYRKRHAIKELDQPLVVLIGGSTGVGKSTIATQLAVRMGITRIISTDAVREVMRSLFSERIMPTLHTSSFEADSVVRGPLPRSADPVIVGFEQQVRAVTVGIEAVIHRAVIESTDLIVEGAHLVPGFIGGNWEEHAVVVPMVVTIEDEELHRSHFFLRAQETKQRNIDRYLTKFGDIRKVQKYIRSLAQQRGVPIIPSYNLDATLATVIDLVVTRAVDRTDGVASAADSEASGA